MSYTRIMVPPVGIEPTDTRIFSPLLYQLSYQGKKDGDPEGARTLDLQRDRLAF